MALQRKVKNVVNNYSPIECKVREATSNDPSGPSLVLMEEISQSTNQVISVPEIMSIIFKRLNDSGKNWRHVYKSLQLLDYLLKNGHESVASQCLENITIINNLRCFQYVENYRDHGKLVRDKAVLIIELFNDLGKLIVERQKALEIKKSRSNNSAVYNDFGSLRTSPQRSIQAPPSEEHVYPNSREEEDLQLKLALKQSLDDAKEEQKSPQKVAENGGRISPNLFDTLIDTRLQQRTLPNSSSNNDQLISFSSTEPPSQTRNTDPFNLIDATWAPQNNQDKNLDPWMVTTTSGNDKLFDELPALPSVSQPDSTFRYVDSLSKLVLEEPTKSGCPAFYEDFKAPSQTNSVPQSSFPISFNAPATVISPNSPGNQDPFGDASLVPSSLSATNGDSQALVKFEDEPKKETVQKPDPVSDFLGEHKSLVDLDKLVTRTNRPSNTNPFSSSSIVPIGEIASLSIKSPPSNLSNGPSAQPLVPFNANANSTSPFSMHFSTNSSHPSTNNTNFNGGPFNANASPWDPKAFESQNSMLGSMAQSNSNWMQVKPTTSISNQQSMNASLNPFL